MRKKEAEITEETSLYDMALQLGHKIELEAGGSKKSIATPQENYRKNLIFPFLDGFITKMTAQQLSTSVAHHWSVFVNYIFSAVSRRTINHWLIKLS